MTSIVITESACKAFKANLESDGSQDKYIRIAIQGGGCAGFKHTLDIADKPEENDTTWEQDGVKFVVDEMSLSYLEGTTIDYKNTLMESGFSFTNEKFKRTCGCGSSFSV